MLFDRICHSHGVERFHKAYPAEFLVDQHHSHASTSNPWLPRASRQIRRGVHLKSRYLLVDPVPMAIRHVPEPPEIIWRDGVEYRRLRKAAGPVPIDEPLSPEMEQRYLKGLFDRQNGRCYHCNGLMPERGKGVRVAGERSQGVLICNSCATPQTAS